MDTLLLLEPKDLLMFVVLGATPVAALVIWLCNKRKSYDSVSASSGAEDASWEGYADSSEDPPSQGNGN